MAAINTFGAVTVQTKKDLANTRKNIIKAGTEYSVPDTELQLERDSSCIDHSGNGNSDGNRICSNSANYADFPIFPEILCKRYRSWRSQRLIQIE